MPRRKTNCTLITIVLYSLIKLDVMNMLRVAGHLLVLSLLLPGCSLVNDDCNDRFPLSDDAKKWIPYQKHQMLYFKSAGGEKDTLVVTEFTEGLELYAQLRQTTTSKY